MVKRRGVVGRERKDVGCCGAVLGPPLPFAAQKRHFLLLFFHLLQSGHL